MPSQDTKTGRESGMIIEHVKTALAVDATTVPQGLTDMRGRL